MDKEELMIKLFETIDWMHSYGYDNLEVIEWIGVFAVAIRAGSPPGKTMDDLFRELGLYMRQYTDTEEVERS